MTESKDIPTTWEINSYSLNGKAPFGYGPCFFLPAQDNRFTKGMNFDKLYKGGEDYCSQT